MTGFWLCHSLAVPPHSSVLTSLGTSVLICEMGTKCPPCKGESQDWAQSSVNAACDRTPRATCEGSELGGTPHWRSEALWMCQLVSASLFRLLPASPPLCSGHLSLLTRGRGSKSREASLRGQAERALWLREGVGGVSGQTIRRNLVLRREWCPWRERERGAEAGQGPMGSLPRALPGSRAAPFNSAWSA